MSNGGTLPQEILTDVLSRLPVKSLCRFKSVSPSWNSLISDPYFAITHLNRTTTRNPQYLYTNKIIMSTHHDLYSVDFADVNWTATKLDFPTVEQRDAVELVRVWGSCDGLLLVSDEGNSNFILLNPSTRECKKLPTCPFFHALVGVGEFVAYAYGVGYDSCTDGYEVVMLSYSSLSHITIVAVYSLRNVACRRLPDFHCMLMQYTCGVLFNGCLPWLGWRAGSFKIVAIDLPNEFFREVPLPIALDACKMGLFYELAALGNCLCLVNRQPSYQVEVWMMKEYGVRESWNKITIEMPDRPRLILLGLLAEDELLFKSDEVILDGDKTKKLVVYNPKKRTMSGNVVCGIPYEFTFGGTYVESLVSPHYGGGIGRQMNEKLLQLNYQVEVWMMKEYGVRESWNKITIEMLQRSTLKLQGLLVEDELLFKPDDVILDRHKTEKLVVYNPKK